MLLTARSAAAAIFVLAALLPASVSADEIEDRIAALERQLAELKSLVARKTSADTLETEALDTAPLESSKRGREMGEMADEWGTQFDYVGYVQLDAIASEYSEGRPAALMDDIFVPSLIPVEPQQGDGDSYRSTNIHAKTSRFGFRTDTRTDAGRLSSFIELDFVLSGQGDERVSNSFSSRIRHAYLEWEYAPGQSLLAGQAWSTFMNTAAVPDLLDLVGPVGTVFERQPLIRWTNGPWQFAVENQATRVNLPGAAPRVDDGQLMPDLVARYNARTGDLRWSVAAIGRQLTYEERDDAGSKQRDDTSFGYGVSLAGKWMLGRDDVRFMVNYGDALGRYMGLNAFNDAYVDNVGDLQGIEQWGGLLAYRHYWSDQWRSSISVSSSLASNPGVGEFTGAGSLARAYRSMHLNLNYLPAPGLQLGGEFLYGVRELEDGRDGDMLRLQFAARYRF